MKGLKSWRWRRSRTAPSRHRVFVTSQSPVTSWRIGNLYGCRSGASACRESSASLHSRKGLGGCSSLVSRVCGVIGPTLDISSYGCQRTILHVPAFVLIATNTRKYRPRISGELLAVTMTLRPRPASPAMTGMHCAQRWPDCRKCGACGSSAKAPVRGGIGVGPSGEASAAQLHHCSKRQYTPEGIDCFHAWEPHGFSFESMLELRCACSTLLVPGCPGFPSRISLQDFSQTTLSFLTGHTAGRGMAMFTSRPVARLVVKRSSSVPMDVETAPGISSNHRGCIVRISGSCGDKRGSGGSREKAHVGERPTSSTSGPDPEAAAVRLRDHHEQESLR